MRIFAQAVLALVLALPAGAGPSPELDRARDDRAHAIAQAARLGRQAAAIASRYRRAEARAAAATVRLIDALREEQAAEARLADARNALSRRVSAVYRAGPGSFIAALLEARSPGDVVSAGEYLERTVERDVEISAEALDAAVASAAGLRAVEDLSDELSEQRRELEELRRLTEIRFANARAAADAAGIRVASLEAAARTIRDAGEISAGAIDALDGADQSELLAMLGPSGGRGCEIPSGLRRTGASFEGTASHYGFGDGFAGQPTATGAIFDPTLFTAAHKTLPLNSFIHVTLGGRCATLLVNDRGPFHLDWVLDISSGAAGYLGYASAGTARVRAEILQPVG